MACLLHMAQLFLFYRKTEVNIYFNRACAAAQRRGQYAEGIPPRLKPEEQQASAAYVEAAGLFR